VARLGDVAQGRDRLERALTIAPEFWVAHLTLAAFQLAEKQADRAIESLERADLADGSAQAAGLLGLALAREGRRDQALAVLQRLLQSEQERYVPPTSIAMVYAGLGEIDRAFAALERAFAVRDTRLVCMKDDGRWAGLRGDPRFAALLQRMKLDRFGAGLAAN
jgi:tetratricopeptide (TPR) repeat protein